MKEEKDKKQGYYFWLKPGTSEMITAHVDAADTRNRSQFVDAAIRHYCCVLDAESNKDLLSDEVLRVMKASVKDSENHIASMLFKISGELSLQNYLLGVMGLELTEKEIQAYRNLAYDKVRKQHGFIKLEDVLQDFEE